MSFPSDTKLSLNVMMNKDKTKVLFAEANTDFINVLLSFLALPLGKVVEINFLTLGSMGTLYESLSCMDESYFCVRGAKNMLLNPRSSLGLDCRTLPIDITYSSPNKYYICSDLECPERAPQNVSLYSNIARCDCGKWLNREILVGESLCGGPFVTKPSSFVVTDDLRVVPVLTGIFQTLRDLGIVDTQDSTEMMSLSRSFGFNEMRKLLDLSLHSATPLTDMVCMKTGTTTFTAGKADPGITLHHIPKEKLPTRKIALKVFLQKSTDKLLYAEATDEFVELLFNFLVVPLGGVEYLTGGNTGFKSIHNLYGSVATGIGDECFRTRETKSSLIHPKLPYCCVAKNRFLPLVGDTLYPKLHFMSENHDARLKDTSFHVQWKGNGSVNLFKLTWEGFVKKHSKFIVTDDLSVSPSLAKSLLILNSLKIPLTDVKEVDFQAVGILKASLTSKTPLTDVLLKPKLSNCKPKQEPSAC